MIKTYKDLIGLTVKDIKRDADTITLTMESGEVVRFYHDQDCCESVAIDSVDGSLDSLIGFPLVMVEEYIGDEYATPGWSAGDPNYYDDSHTWTKYEFTTSNFEKVAVRWFGTSNGYYSESVNFAVVS